MAETTYDLVFRAELLPDGDGATARSTLARVLKLDETRLQQLFSGGVVYVRRAVDRDTAVRFQAAFRQAGARLRVIPLALDSAQEATTPAGGVAAAPGASVASAPPAPARKPSLAERLAARQPPPETPQDVPAATPAVFGGSASAQTPASAAASAAAAEEEDHGGTIDFVPSNPADRAAAADAAAAAAAANRVAASAPGTTSAAEHEDEEMIEFTLAPVGADLIAEEEREVKAEVMVSVEHIRLAPPGGTIPVLHPRDDIRPTVKIPDFDVAEAGALLAELTEFVELPLDLDAYSLAPPGATLGSPSAQVPALDPEIQHRLAQMNLAPVGSDLRGSPRP